MQTDPLSVTLGGIRVSGDTLFEKVASFGQHTVGTLEILIPGGTNPWVAPEWTPVTLRLTDGRVSEPWYGYVHHGGVVTTTYGQRNAVVRYTLIGTSLPLNDEKTRSWKNVTRSSIVRQIAKEHRLRTLMSVHRTVIPYYAQSGSDWRVLKDMADQTGYRLWVDGSTVRFVDAKLLLEGVSVSETPTFSQSVTPGVLNTLHQFESKIGTMVPRAGGTAANQVVNGIDVRNKTIIKATSTTSTQNSGSPAGSTPVLHKVNTGIRVSQYGQASELVSSASINTQGWLTATAVVTGSPSLEPGSIIDIEGNRIPADQHGLWLVTKATQRVMREEPDPRYVYTTLLELERDQFYSPTFRSNYKTTNTRDSVGATMRDGLFWEADYMEDINVG